MHSIPFFRPSISSDEIDEVIDTLKSGWLTTGPKTKQFERDFAAFMRQKHAVAVNSCTAALHLALEAIGVEAGDGVLVPTMTFAATAEVVRYFGGIPILVDCREADLNLDVADAERRVRNALENGQRVKAILPVHYGGQIGDVRGVTELAARYGLKVIEDAAHCCPAYYREPGRAGEGIRTAGTADPAALAQDGWLPVGSAAAISCYSFYANKCITTGEGGMACTENDDYADRMRIMSLHGISRDAWKRYSAEGNWYYEIIAPGFKYNLTDIAAAIGLHQLRKALQFHRRRRELAELYRSQLADVEELILPVEFPDRIHSWHLFPIRLRLDRIDLSRVELVSKLAEAGMGTSVHYTPLHMHPYYREKFGYRPEDLPQMASVYPELITLPLYPELQAAEVERVCVCIRGLIARHRKTRILPVAV